jgi:hypothetical protein
VRWRELVWWLLVPAGLVVLAQVLSRRARAQRFARVRDLHDETDAARAPAAPLLKGRSYQVLHDLPSSGEPFKEGEIVRFVGSIRLPGDDAIECVFSDAEGGNSRTLTLHGGDGAWRESFRELPSEGPPFT